MGAAATLKATAWPALLVCGVLIAARQGRLGRYSSCAGAVLAIGVLVPAFLDPTGLFENAVRFPLGLAAVASPATSPLPGHLLASLGPWGHTAALAAPGLAIVATGVSLFGRPPTDAPAAARRLTVGILLAAALMPATRWGYLFYPVVLFVWAQLADRPARASRDNAQIDHAEAELWRAA